MGEVAIRNMHDASALVLGLGMFATGGGGVAARGHRYLERLIGDGFVAGWSRIEELEPDMLTCSVYGMGSIAPHPPMTEDERRAFGVHGEPFPSSWIRAAEQLEAHLGRRIGAVIPFELGPSASIVALDTAVRTGRTLVDGDYIGRALPRMSQALPAVAGLDTWPLAITDPFGNALIMTDCASPAVAERIGKMVSKVTKAVDMAAPCSHAAFPITAERARTAVIGGSLSRSLAVGREILAAREAGDDAVAAAARAVDGDVLLRGRVSGFEWEDTADGYMEGTTTILCDGGATAKVWFLNEHHLVTVDDEPRAMSPDIVAVVDAGDAEPISNSELEAGRDVALVGTAAAPPYREGAGLAATEPRHYGIDLDYTPIERLNSTGAWT
jgi:DUF917 family protein